MWQLLLNFIGGPIIAGVLKAYQAKLAAGNTSEKIAADLASRELAVEQREAEVASQVIIAEEGRWWTAMPRPAFAFAFVLYIWKVVVWDKVFGWGSTPELSPDLTHVFTIILTAYFGGRTIEKVARIIKR